MLAQKCRPGISEFWPEFTFLLEQRIKFVLINLSGRKMDSRNDVTETSLRSTAEEVSLVSVTNQFARIRAIIFIQECNKILNSDDFSTLLNTWKCRKAFNSFSTNKALELPEKKLLCLKMLPRLLVLSYCFSVK